MWLCDDVGRMAVVVISYSRSDQPQIRAVVGLLRATLNIERAVYWDDDFAAGEDWFEQLKRSVDESHQLFVFWCRHAAASQEVRREFAYALDKGKRVVPVLLDDTPLSQELAAIHGIDLRGAIRHGRLAIWPAFHRPLLAILAAAASLMFLWVVFARPAPLDSPPAPIDGLNQISGGTNGDMLFLIVAIICFVVYGATYVSRRRRIARQFGRFMEVPADATGISPR